MSSTSWDRSRYNYGHEFAGDSGWGGAPLCGSLRHESGLASGITILWGRSRLVAAIGTLDQARRNAALADINL